MGTGTDILTQQKPIPMTLGTGTSHIMGTQYVWQSPCDPNTAITMTMHHFRMSTGLPMFAHSITPSTNTISQMTSVPQQQQQHQHPTLPSSHPCSTSIPNALIPIDIHHIYTTQTLPPPKQIQPPTALTTRPQMSI